MTYTLNEIGTVAVGNEQETILRLAPDYREALQGLEEHSHIMVLYWFHHLDVPELRKQVCLNKPYVHGPEVLGVFATRGPLRPNPIAVSIAEVKAVDHAAGTITLVYLDAAPESPILDIKPYIPSSEIVEHYQTPIWCQHWPKTYESSGMFDWESEFTPFE